MVNNYKRVKLMFIFSSLVLIGYLIFNFHVNYDLLKKYDELYEISQYYQNMGRYDISKAIREASIFLLNISLFLPILVALTIRIFDISYNKKDFINYPKIINDYKTYSSIRRCFLFSFISIILMIYTFNLSFRLFDINSFYWLIVLGLLYLIDSIVNQMSDNVITRIKAIKESDFTTIDQEEHHEITYKYKRFNRLGILILVVNSVLLGFSIRNYLNYRSYFNYSDVIKISKQANSDHYLCPQDFRIYCYDVNRDEFLREYSLEQVEITFYDRELIESMISKPYQLKLIYNENIYYYNISELNITKQNDSSTFILSFNQTNDDFRHVEMVIVNDQSEEVSNEIFQQIDYTIVLRKILKK